MNMFGMMWTLHFSSHILRPGLRHFLVHPHWLASLNTITHIIHCQWYVMRKFTGNKALFKLNALSRDWKKLSLRHVGESERELTGTLVCADLAVHYLRCVMGRTTKNCASRSQWKVSAVCCISALPHARDQCRFPPLSKRQDSNGREGCKYSRRKLHFRVMRLPLCLHYLFLWK